MFRLRLRLLLLWTIPLLAASNSAWAMGLAAVDSIEERFRLSEKVGWYRLDDGAERWLTWNTNGGLRLIDIDSGEMINLRPVTPAIFAADGGARELSDVQFDQSETGEVVGFRWLDTNGVERSAERLTDPPYGQRELSFQNGALELTGLLLLPTTPSRHGAVIIIGGSSECAREDPWVLYQADYLARRGIAVFLPDSRGTGKSEGDWKSASFDQLATDVTLAAQIIGQQADVDASRIGLVGMREGAWVAPIAAATSEQIRFLVTVSGYTLSPRDQMRYGISSDVRRYGTPDFLVPLIAFALEFTSTRRGESWWDRNGRFDPIPYWSQLDKPVLAVYGDPEEAEDFPVRRTFQRLQEVRSASGNPDFTIRLIDDADEKLRDDDSGRIHPEYLELLASWITSRTA